jgi:hypothetical protein
MKYKILVQKAGTALKTDFERAAEKLSLKVNEAIRDGWEPKGGVAVGKTAAVELPYLMQAMIKRD